MDNKHELSSFPSLAAKSPYPLRLRVWESLSALPAGLGGAQPPKFFLVHNELTIKSYAITVSNKLCCNSHSVSVSLHIHSNSFPFLHATKRCLMRLGRHRVHGHCGYGFWVSAFNSSSASRPLNVFLVHFHLKMKSVAIKI